MHLVIASPHRLQREAIRRSLLRSVYVVDAYAPDLDALRAAISSTSPRLVLLSADCGDLAPAAAELPRRGITVAVLAGGNELEAVYQAVVGNSATVITPPTIDDNGELHGAQRFMAQLDRLHRSMVPSAAPRADADARARRTRTAHTPLIAIGASTGGPAAIRLLLNALPRPLPAAVLVVQHIDAEYTQGFSDWLQSVCGLPAHLVCGDEVPKPGQVYVAPAGHHLVVLGDGRLALQRGSPQDAHRPAVDPLFRSLVAQTTPGIAVLLTGMGDDGAAALRSLREHRWRTFAQDAASAVVHGMPGAAIALHAAEEVLDPGTIGVRIGFLLAGAP